MLDLIEQYELRECLWNVLSNDYKIKIRSKMHGKNISFHIVIHVDIVEKKVKSLLAVYRCERRKEADAKNSGSGADDIKVPKWFAYQRFT
jgi:hypothetical protein